MSKHDEKHTSELSMEELDNVAGGVTTTTPEPPSLPSGPTKGPAPIPLPGPMLPGPIKTGPLL